MKHLSFCLALLLLCLSAPATAADLAYYLPAETDYDSAIPTPEEVLGQEVGQWHLRPDQLVRYLEVLSEKSDRLTLEVQGKTHEGQMQVLLVATSPANHRRLEAIRTQHVALSDPRRDSPSEAELASMPAVVLLGYSIHGNEASGANASVLTAYHLAAARGAEVEALLDELVVLIDPALNPDGIGRFALWANSHRGVVPVAERQSREHHEGWPNARTNHYWFDLNRDWLLLQHPESRNRVATFHRWKPNVLGDYHEMGSDSTYFFQPGVASRKNPLTPAKNVELTSAIARFHAAAFDAAGQLYYSEETFDDFYPGKGSTYPDLNGSVGILFEQASSRGHLLETVHGKRDFAETIRNHLRTSLSTLAGAQAHRVDLLRYQNDFYRSAAGEAAKDPVRGFVFAFPHDPALAYRALKLLRQHQIEVYRLTKEIRSDSTSELFSPGEAFVVPMAQPQYRLARSLFERRTEFEDSTFYDISTWTLPLAFGAQYAELGKGEFAKGLLGESIGELAAPAGKLHTVAAGTATYAYLVDPRGSLVARSLGSLLAAHHRAYVSTRPLTAEVAGGSRLFPAGTLILPAAGGGESLRAQLEQLAERDAIQIFATHTGRTPEGVDLGSPSIVALTLPRPLLVVGRGVSASEAGELWYLLDHHYGVETSMVDLDLLPDTDLSVYTHMLMVSGEYDEVDPVLAETMRRWVRDGGTLLATRTATRFALEEIVRDPVEEDGEEQTGEEAGGLDLAKEAEKGARVEPNGEGDFAAPLASYADYSSERAKQLVSGAIVQADLDLTHPLAFGFQHSPIALFRTHSRPMEGSENPYENVARYSAQPWLSGYISPRNRGRLAGTVAITVARVGEGTVVRLADDPFFRSYWYGTSRFVLNTLFYGPIVQRTLPPGRW